MPRTWRTTAAGDVAMRLGMRPMLLPEHYAWLLLVSAMDAMMTWAVLSLGGVEVNPLADAVLAEHGFPGMVMYKFALVLLVIIFCEWIGRRDQRSARRLAVAAVALSSVPVVWAMLHLAVRLHLG